MLLLRHKFLSEERSMVFLPVKEASLKILAPGFYLRISSNPALTKFQS